MATPESDKNGRLVNTHVLYVAQNSPPSLVYGKFFSNLRYFHEGIFGFYATLTSIRYILLEAIATKQDSRLWL